MYTGEAKERCPPYSQYWIIPLLDHRVYPMLDHPVFVISEYTVFLILDNPVVPLMCCISPYSEYSASVKDIGADPYT